MQKRGEVQKGFFLIVVVLLAVAFVASFYTDPTGEAVRSGRNRELNIIGKTQPFTFLKGTQITSPKLSPSATVCLVCTPGCGKGYRCGLWNNECRCQPIIKSKVGEACGTWSPLDPSDPENSKWYCWETPGVCELDAYCDKRTCLCTKITTPQ